MRNTTGAIGVLDTTSSKVGAWTKAMVHERYGPDALELRDVAVPEIGNDEVLVRVRASSVNPVDWYGVYAPPFVRVIGRQLRRPKDPRLGSDLAGVVEAVGRNVHGLRPGDEVFGTSDGSWAEHTATSSARLARKPASISFEEAAAVPIAGLTALQAVRDHGAVQPGQKVLVNGASGGVGTFAVQLASAYGAEVTAVCSTRNVELVQELGAARAVDYTRDDFTQLDARHDVVLDIAGSCSFSRLRRVLAPNATVVVIGAKMSYSLLGPLKHIAATRLQGIGRSQQVKFFAAKIQTADLNVMADLLANRVVRSVIDRRYELRQAPDALRYLGEGHAQGKVVLTL